MPSRSILRAIGVTIVALLAVLLAASLRADGLPFTPGALFSDASTSHYPEALFLRESVLEQGEFPLWRETFMAGAPFAANPLNKTAYPLQWIGLLLEPLTLLNGLIVAHFLIAGAGMWRWVRSLGISPYGALVSALAYMLAPRVLAQLGAGHLDLFYAAAWWPWLMWSAGRLGSRGSWRIAVLTGLFAGLVVLADVRMAAYALPCAVVAYFISWGRAGRKADALIYAVASAALAVGLALAVIVPVVGWSPWMNRAALTAADSGADLMNASTLLGVFVPSPASGGQETLTYLGIATLVLAVVGAFALPRRWRYALGIAVLVIVLMALGSNGPIWPLLTSQHGLLSWFRIPARIWFVVVLLAAPLAGLGVDTLLAAVPRLAQHPARLRWLRLAAFGLMVGAATVGLLLIAAVPAARLNGVQMLLVGGALGLALLLALSGCLRGDRLLALLIVLMIADAVFSARTWITWQPSSHWLGPYQAVTEALKADDAARVYSPSYSLPQEAVANAGLRLFGGVDPFQIAGVSAAIMRAGGIEHEGYSIVMPPLSNETGDWRDSNRDAPLDPALLAEWDVSHVVAAYPIEHPDLALLTEIDGTYTYRNLAYQPASQASIEPNYPSGWPALPDQAEVARLNTLTLNAWIGSIALFVISLGFLVAGVVLGRRPGHHA